MPITSVLLYCDDGADYPARSKVAFDLAHRHEAQLLVVSVEPKAHNIPNLYGRTGYLGQEIALKHERMRQSEKEMKDLCLREGVACTWFWSDSAPLDALTRHSFHADLAVVSQTPANTLEDVLFDFMPDHLAITGSCPVLILPKGFGDTLEFRHPLIAWKNRRESALALRGAIPLLKTAKEISMLSVNPKNDEELLAGDIIRFLERQGVKRTAFQVRDNEEGSAYDIVLDTYNKKNCDYLIMGGYGQSQLKEWILGGFTRTFLDKMPMPIFMAH